MPSELRSRSVLRDRALREPCRGDGRPLRDAVAKRKQGRRKRRRGEEGVRLEVVSRAEAHDASLRGEGLVARLREGEARGSPR